MPFFSRTKEVVPAAAPAPRVRDTEGARADLRVARQYIDEYRNAKGMDRRADWLVFALKYIYSAREKDVDGTVQIKLDNGNIGLCTPDGLEGEVLFLQAILISPNAPWENKKVRLEKLIKAVALCPIPSIYTELAETYLADSERGKAITLIKEGMQKFPDDFSLRSCLDTIESQAQLGTPTRPPAEFSFGSVLVSLGVLLLVVWAAMFSIRGISIGPYSLFFFGGVFLLIWGIKRKMSG